MEYNFNYIKDLYTKYSENSDTSLSQINEINILMDYIDERIDGVKRSNIFHIVPIVYSSVFLIGSFVFGYKILSIN